MIDSIFRILPDWAVSVIFGGLIWYGANYILLADLAIEADLRVLRGKGNIDQNFLRCYVPAARGWISRNKAEYALHTATLGFIPSEASLGERMEVDVVPAVRSCMGG